MKNFFCILLLTALVGNLSAQTVKFNNIYTGNTPGLRNILIVDDGYIGLGFDYYTTKISILIIKTDIYGNLIWTKIYGDSQFDYYHGTRNSLIENTDGGYSLAGHRTNAANDYRACMLMKFDQNFDTLWTKLYFDNANFTVFYNHIQTTDGGYALVGTHDEDDPDGDVLLVKTDSEGNMLWYKKYGTSGRDLGVCIIETPDKGFLIGGGTSFGNGDNYIVKTDSVGNLEWTKNYGSPIYRDGGVSNIIKTLDSGYIFTASETLYIISTEIIPEQKKGTVKKVDNNYDDVWYRLYGSPSSQTGIGSIVETQNGELAAILIDGPQDEPSVSSLLFLTASGDSIRQITYEAQGSIFEQWLLAIKQTPDNGFIMAGVAYEPQVMWLVKTDSCGCIVEDCDCGGSAVEQHIINNGIEVYPTPANIEIWIEYLILKESPVSKIDIYNIEGKLVLTQAIRNGFGVEQVDVSQLSEGNYILKIGEFTKQISVIK